MPPRSYRYVFALPLAFLFLTHGASAQEAITTPILGLPVSNFRDIAGVAQQFGGSGYAYSTSNQGTMRTGVFYRSNALGGMSTADQATVNKLGITLDIDLRTPGEIASDPDIVPTGASYVNINVIGTQSTSLTATTPAQMISYMQMVNQQFVTAANERSAIANVLLDLANAQGPALYHCTAGKDRTGWVTAVLDSIAGMSSSDIMANYLATNAYSATLIQDEMQAYTAKYGAAYASVIAPALGVQSSFLQAGLDQVTTSYGSMQNYLLQGLGLTQADIYVLRAKMVYYSSLPGEAAMQGNDAAGAALLRNLQNSPLSGHYTAFNYYLQSAIDAGTLNGEQAVVGGQIYADTASALSRAALQTNQLIAAYVSGVDLAPGKGTAWMTDIGSYADNQGANGNANDIERLDGGLIGATYRPTTQAAINAGFGYGTGTISGAGASTTLDTYNIIAGGRYGFSSLEQGYYTSLQAEYEYAMARTRRGLGNGLGTASGHGHDNVYSGQLTLGDRYSANGLTLSPQIGIYASYLNANGLTENGSSLALSESRLTHIFTALVTSLPIELPQSLYQGWAFEPVLTPSYARVLGSPDVRSTGMLDGYTISQDAAFHSANLFGLNAGLTSAKGAFSLQGNAGAQFTTNGGTGFNGRLTLAYKF